MIYENDGKNFGTMMIVTWQSFGRNKPDRETMRFWFDKLIAYDMKTVESAFDEWLKTQNELPKIAEILKFCKPLPSYNKLLNAPLDNAKNAEYAKNVIDFVGEQTKAKSDKRDWARKIIANPKNYPDISFRYATEALSAKAA